MMHFKFIEDINSYKPANSFLALVSSEVRSKEELLNELSQKLRFPDYFGFNWDALRDCLRDFHWMKEKVIILKHSGIPHVEEEILRKYIEVLIEAAQDWKKEDEHYLEVIFPKSSEKALKALISEWGDL